MTENINNHAFTPLEIALAMNLWYKSLRDVGARQRVKFPIAAAHQKNYWMRSARRRRHEVFTPRPITMTWQHEMFNR